MNGDDWLDKVNFDYNNSNYGWTMISTKSRECRLHPYTTDNVVTCIDSIHSVRQSSSDSLLHFVFVGDSRARQQFYNFIKVLLEPFIFEKKNCANKHYFIISFSQIMIENMTHHGWTETLISILTGM